MAKMGRPKAESPKQKKINIRVTNKEYEELSKYASEHAMTITQVVLQGIKLLIQNPE